MNNDKPVDRIMLADNTADRIALMDVMARYAMGADQRDMQTYRNCFADDVEIIGFGNQRFKGAEAWLQYVTDALKKYSSTQHLLGPQLATINGDRASTRTDVQALHFLKDKPDTTLTLWATYNTEMARLGGEWKIIRHELETRGTRLSNG